MVKTLRCSSCGAALKFAPGQPNVVCEYCNSFVRVANEAAAHFDAESILEQIVRIWPRVRNDNKTPEYEVIKELIGKHKYIAANKRLNRILEDDNTQARAWFYKSLLPVLDQDTVLFKGCYVNIVKVSQITNRKLLRKYLKTCGLSIFRQNEFLNYYRSTDFLFEQHLKFLDKAIEHASTEERAEFFKEAKKTRVKLQKQKISRKFFATWGLIFLLFAVVAGGFIVVWNVLQGNWNV